jgi:hypothetical protein
MACEKLILSSSFQALVAIDNWYVRDWQISRRCAGRRNRGDELLRQVIQQFRIGRRVAGANVVQRLDQPTPSR